METIKGNPTLYSLPLGINCVDRIKIFFSGSGVGIKGNEISEMNWSIVR